MWLVNSFLKYGPPFPKLKHKNPNIFCLKESAGPGGLRRLHKHQIWYFGPHFLSFGYWRYPSSKANNTTLGSSIKIKWKWYCQHYQTTKDYPKENPKWPWEITFSFLWRKERRKACWTCRCFLPKSRYNSRCLRNIHMNTAAYTYCIIASWYC